MNTVVIELVNGANGRVSFVVVYPLAITSTLYILKLAPVNVFLYSKLNYSIQFAPVNLPFI